MEIMEREKKRESGREGEKADKISLSHFNIDNSRSFTIDTAE